MIMPKINKHIEIVHSSKATLSSMGSQYAGMVETILSQSYSTVGVSVVNTIGELDQVISRRPDLLFLGIKRLPVDAAATGSPLVWVADYLDQQQITYTGSPGAAIALDFDKLGAKLAVLNANVKTAAAFMASPHSFKTAAEIPLAFPLFVKPPSAGGGQGIGPGSVTRDFTQFQAAVVAVDRKFSSLALVESYLPGREFSVGVIKSLTSSRLLALPVELIASENENGDRILGRSAKKADNERVEAVTDAGLRAAISDLAVSAFGAMGARDYGRIDIRLDDTGTPNFLEANLIPGLHNRTSYFTKAYQLNLGLGYEDMILHVAELGLMRAVTTAQTLNNAAFLNYPSTLGSRLPA